MYSSFHSAVGIGILALPLPLPITIPLAIASHAVVDMLGERGFPNALKQEIPLHIALLVVGVITGTLPIVVGGILLANMFDIIDKGLALPLLKHQLIHTQKWYPKALIQFTVKMTKFLNLTSVCVVSAILGLTSFI